MAPLVTSVGYDWAFKQTAKCIKELIQLVQPASPPADLFSQTTEAPFNQRTEEPPATTARPDSNAHQEESFNQHTKEPHQLPSDAAIATAARSDSNARQQEPLNQRTKEPRTAARTSSLLKSGLAGAVQSASAPSADAGQKASYAPEPDQRQPPPVTITCKPADSLDHIANASIDVIVMDPPYYDNVMYAELSDFFYVWLKRTAGHVFPELFRRQLTDKDS